MQSMYAGPKQNTAVNVNTLNLDIIRACITVPIFKNPGKAEIGSPDKAVKRHSWPLLSHVYLTGGLDLEEPQSCKPAPVEEVETIQNRIILSTQVSPC